VYTYLGKLRYILDFQRLDKLYMYRSSNKMPASVKQAIRDAVAKYGGNTEDEAKEFVIQMERKGRLIEECWS